MIMIHKTNSRKLVGFNPLCLGYMGDLLKQGIQLSWVNLGFIGLVKRFTTGSCKPSTCWNIWFAQPMPIRLDPNMACSQYSFHCMVEQDLGPDAEYLKQWKQQGSEPVDMEVEVETIDVESQPCAGAVTSNNQLFCSSSHGYLWNNHHQSSVPWRCWMVTSWKNHFPPRFGHRLQPQSQQQLMVPLIAQQIRGNSLFWSSPGKKGSSLTTIVFWQLVSSCGTWPPKIGCSI